MQNSWTIFSEFLVYRTICDLFFSYWNNIDLTCRIQLTARVFTINHHLTEVYA